MSTLHLEGPWICYIAHCQTPVLLKEKANVEKFKISAGADGSPCSQVCAHSSLSSASHQHQRKFFGACVWGRGVKQKNSLPFQAILNPTITPSGRKVLQGEEEERKRKNAVNSGHLVP